MTRVYVNDKDGVPKEYDVFDTCLLAIGRTGLAGKINCEAAGISYNAKSGKIPVDAFEKTNVDNIFAIGDVVEGMLELTPVAIAAGKALAKRLYGSSKKPMDYNMVPTTVFTPLEYGCIGYAEEDAIKKFGDEIVNVYHRYTMPLEWKCNSARRKDLCFMKVVCLAEEGADGELVERVIGFHVLTPNAGEITQGFATAMKTGCLTKELLDDTVGIHPTVAEDVTTITELKEPGKVLESGGNC